MKFDVGVLEIIKWSWWFFAMSWEVWAALLVVMVFVALVRRAKR